MSKILLSKQKIDSLKKELARLKREVIEHHENEHENIKMSMREAASYDVTIGAKQAKVKELEKILNNVEILPDKVDSERVTLGSWVELRDEEGNLQKYRLIHPLEADPKNVLLSIKSPFGKLLLGKRIDEKVTLNGNNFTITGIS